MADVISTALPAVTPRDQSVYTVETGDPAAVITTFTIHLSQDAPADLLPEAPLPPLFNEVTTG